MKPSYSFAKNPIKQIDQNTKGANISAKAAWEYNAYQKHNACYIQ
jgi:hypothetical protein